MRCTKNHRRRLHHLLPNLRWQLSRLPPTEELKETFLTNHRELLLLTLTVMEFIENSLEVIDPVLIIDSAQTSRSMSMASLWRALLKDYEIHFRQTIQCTICLNLGHWQSYAHGGFIAQFAICGQVHSNSASITC